MQIDLEPHEHSTLIEVVKIPKGLFYLVAAIWVGVVACFALIAGYGWPALALAVFSLFVGVGWVGAFPEYHMRRLHD